MWQCFISECKWQKDGCVKSGDASGQRTGPRNSKSLMNCCTATLATAGGARGVTTDGRCKNGDAEKPSAMLARTAATMLRCGGDQRLRRGEAGTVTSGGERSVRTARSRRVRDRTLIIYSHAAYHQPTASSVGLGRRAVLHRTGGFVEIIMRPHLRGGQVTSMRCPD